MCWLFEPRKGVIPQWMLVFDTPSLVHSFSPRQYFFLYILAATLWCPYFTSVKKDLSNVTLWCSDYKSYGVNVIFIWVWTTHAYRNRDRERYRDTGIEIERGRDSKTEIYVFYRQIDTDLAHSGCQNNNCQI